MSSPKQWDISRALATAGFFHFFHNIGNFCVMPFLTIFFRQLGLSAPLVGILIGMKHLVYVLWAPLSSYLAKTNSKRRILIMMSLILSAGAGLILTFYPPLDKDIISRHCNGSNPWKDQLITPGAVNLGGLQPQNSSFSHIVLESPITTPIVSTSITVTVKEVFNTSSRVEMSSSVNSTMDLEPTVHHSSPSINLKTSTPGLSDQSLSSHVPEEKLKKANYGNSSLTTIQQNTSATEVVHDGRIDIPKVENQVNSSSHRSDKPTSKKKVRDVNLELSYPSYFFNGEHKNFLISLGAIIIWELMASPLEWTVDDSLYEYLDFVDATDRHGKLWIFSYLGACLGSSLITLLVDNLDCYFIASIPRVYLHFYGYSVFIILTLMLSPLFPIHVSKKSEHANKTLKALGLIGNDGRVILLSVTVFLTGALASTAQNFLFWRMQDVGSTELYMGLSITIALLSEILLYIFRTKLMKAISFKWMVVLGLGCLAMQLLAYSFIWTSWAVLPIQVLSAFSNGALWWTVLSQVDDVATPGTERSLQLVLHCLFHGCGASVGSFASGFIISSFSLPILFQACAVTLVLWIMLFLLVQPKLPHVKKINYSRLLAADQSDMSDSEEDHDRDWLVEAMKEETKITKW
ncbi:major facilitator superfamily domain-containing protein 6-like [Pelobates fuscus]|uniref:major facilitator superfamily domain-containing protein 6-like n=1 Tax=Pelobates fuscus TaxID=191477 RepID=UPI002FE4DD9B